MAIFNGTLLSTPVNGAIFPNKYIKIDTFDSNPNMREEIKAVRDDYTRDLTRVTAQGTKSTFKFSTVDDIHLTEMQEILDFFTQAEVDDIEHLQRKIKLKYWNDEEMKYKEGYFYRPNMTFRKKEISDDDIIYSSLDLEFIEY